MSRSSLYDCRVMHHRLEPLQNRFQYAVYMACLDLDEIDDLDRSLRLFSRNRRNLFEFRDSDHLSIVPGDLRTNIIAFLRRNGLEDPPARIVLLTHLRTMGHLFNPVSFYFCYDDVGRPVCAVAEVGNTFDEQKAYLLPWDEEAGGFRRRVPKHFYVSPFIGLDATFVFDLRPPDERLSIRIDDEAGGRRFFLSTLTGVLRSVSDVALVREFFRVPFVTLKVLGLIHWQALKLWLRRLPYHPKKAHVELQKDVVSWNR